MSLTPDSYDSRVLQPRLRAAFPELLNRGQAGQERHIGLSSWKAGKPAGAEARKLYWRCRSQTTRCEAKTAARWWKAAGDFVEDMMKGVTWVALVRGPEEH